MPKDIVSLALLNEKIPAGITRHMISKRIICVNLPLSKLGEDGTVEENAKWLERLLYKDIITGNVAKEPYRIYNESTVIFQSRCDACTDDPGRPI